MKHPSRFLTGPTWPLSVACLLGSLAAGAAAYAAHIPLAWVLGPLAATALFAIVTGQTPVAPLAGRRFGQIVIGSAVGLKLTPDVFAMLLSWVPLMILTALLAMLAGAVLAWPLAHFGKVDVKTAYYAMMPGGLSEMANIGAEHGAQNEPIALAQAIRVALVVSMLPPLIVSLGIAGQFQNVGGFDKLSYGKVPLLLVVGLVGVFAVRMLRLNNPWMIGALLGAAALAATGYLDGRMPRPIFYLGQFLIGIAIGARFRRDIVVRLPRLALVGSILVVAMTGMLLAYAALLAAWTGIDFGSAALASSPGGFAEMAATAETLHLNVALVTGFHVMRALFVNSLTTHIWSGLRRLGFVRD